MKPHSFGYWLKRKRKGLDLTREDLAKQAGYSAATIRKIEDEERRPSAQLTERLAEFFDIRQEERTAFVRFARGESRSVPRETNANFPWRASGKSTRSNVPATVTSLIGREKEIADIREYLLQRDIRLVTLIGPPGIGKTRLSIEAAHVLLSNFPDGVFFVALAPLDNTSLIASVIIRALGFVESRKQSANEQLMNGIAEKHIFLILDNCEHLIEDIAPLVSELLSTCPNLKILSTSREALRVPGEWLYPLPPLDAPDENEFVPLEIAFKFPALTLFAARARAVQPDFTLNAANLQTVIAICSHLDGLPLAIELLAARMRLMSPQVLLQHLNDQFILSADGMRAVSARQKTLNNAIRWSYNLLPSEEQTAFAYLSVFSGGFGLDAAEALFSDMPAGTSLMDLLTSLCHKNLLQSVVGAGSQARFNMLATIQQFAQKTLRERAEETKARDRHLAYFLALAEKGNKEIHGPSQIEWGNHLEREHENFRAALDWSISSQNTEAAARLLCDLGWSWFVRGHYEEAQYWLEKIRSLPDIHNYPYSYAALLHPMGLFYWARYKTEKTRSLWEESQAIALGLGEPGELILAQSLNWLGLLFLFENNQPNKALSIFQRGFELHRRLNNSWGMALSTFHLGIAESQMAHYDAGLILLERSLSMFEELGDAFFVAKVSYYLADLFLKQGDFEKAEYFLAQQLRIDSEVHYWDSISDGWQALGSLYRFRGKLDKARECYEKSLALHHELGLKEYIGDNLNFLGLLLLHHNDYSAARQYFIDAFDSNGVIEDARAYELLTGLAAVAGGTNQAERAAKLHGASEMLLGSSPPETLQADRAEFDRRIQIAREQLGEHEFEKLAAEGRAMTMEQAIAFALEPSIHS
jgi:predicted ATPase/Tfp pilus assembly protein PilF/DNA-binding XRE family transcriptional regulator